MKASWIVGLVVSLAAGYTFAGTHLIYAGGGGEDQDEENQFYKSAMALSAKSSLFKTTKVLFDGYHAEQQRNVQEAYNPSSTKMFTEKTFDVELSKAQELIEAGSISGGDQLLLFIDTHGWPFGKEDNSHSVSTMEGKIDLRSKLKGLIAVAEKHNVRLAIVDNSCHSGVSQTLADKNTCVISSADDKVGYVDFPLELANALKSGRSLEDAFLLTRQSVSKTASNPMISTDEDKKIRSELKHLFPLLTHHQTDVARKPDVMGDVCRELPRAIQDLLEAKVHIGGQFGDRQFLEDQLNSEDSVRFLSSTSPYGGGGAIASNRKTLLQSYRETVADYRRDLDTLQNPKWDSRTLEASGPGYQFNLSYESLLFWNPDKEIARHELNAQKASTPEDRQDHLGLAEAHRRQKLAVEAELPKHPELQELRRVADSSKRKANRLRALAEEIKAVEAKIYDDMYRAEMARASNDKGSGGSSRSDSEPCRDFVL